MAHFARLDNNNVVVRVSSVDDHYCCDKNGIESEEVGVAYLQAIHGKDTVWKQTSYNAKIRKNYAFIGCKYDSELDAFLTPQPFKSWTLNSECQWVPPVPHPTTNPENGNSYIWDESNLRWVLVGPDDDISQYMSQVLPFTPLVVEFDKATEFG
jgi:hypothetical protein